MKRTKAPNTPPMFRQGDVLVMAVDEVPAGATPVERDGGRIVLAYGEVTGHAHAIAEPRTTLLSFVKPDSSWREEANQTFLRVDAPAVLRHEEHAPIPLPVGAYRVIRQREFNPVTNRVSYVRD